MVVRERYRAHHPWGVLAPSRRIGNTFDRTTFGVVYHR